jgi:hypothetical protein
MLGSNLAMDSESSMVSDVPSPALDIYLDSRKRTLMIFWNSSEISRESSL